jgi:hypothetical protein
MGIDSGKVKDRSVRKNRDGDHDVLMLKVEMTEADDVRLVELFTQAGEKFNPPNNTKFAILTIGSAYKIAVACDDGIDPSGVNPGERKLYSMDEDGGSEVTKLHFKNTGDIDLETDANLNAVIGGTAKVTASDISLIGPVSIQGDVEVEGKIHSTDSVESDMEVKVGLINLTTHKHTETGSTTSTPIP